MHAEDVLSLGLGGIMLGENQHQQREVPSRSSALT